MAAQNWQILSQFGDDASSKLIEMLQTLDEQVQQGGGGSQPGASQGAAEIFVVTATPSAS